MTGKRILVIENEVVIAMDLQGILETAGAAEVECAVTENEALELLNQGAWDAVVADANLHGRSIRTVAADMLARQIPFVMVSGYCREHLPPELAGVPFLSKPVNRYQLIDTISRLVAS